MGWNDHVSADEMQCLDCGEVNLWESWDDVGKARYSGDLGKMLGVDVSKSDRCPDCGSTRGKPVPDDWDGDMNWDNAEDVAPRKFKPTPKPKPNHWAEAYQKPAPAIQGDTMSRTDAEDTEYEYVWDIALSAGDDPPILDSESEVAFGTREAVILNIHRATNHVYNEIDTVPIRDVANMLINLWAYMNEKLHVARRTKG